MSNIKITSVPLKVAPVPAPSQPLNKNMSDTIKIASILLKVAPTQTLVFTTGRPRGIVINPNNSGMVSLILEVSSGTLGKETCNFTMVKPGETKPDKTGAFLGLGPAGQAIYGSCFTE